jgi:integrase
MSVTLRYRKIQDKGYSVYLDIYNQGKRTYEYLEIYTSQDYNKVKRVKEQDKDKQDFAEKVKLKTELAIKNGEYGFANASKRKADFIKYFESLCVKKDSNNYNSTLLKLKDFSGGSLLFSELTEQKIKDFITYLQKQSLSQTTVLHYYKMLSATLNDAVRDKFLATNPTVFIPQHEKPKKIESKREYLTMEEIRKLNDTPLSGNPQIKTAFLFGCFCGLRISDIKKLTWDEIHDEKIEYRQKKTQKVEYLPLGKQALTILGKIEKHETNNLVFWNLPNPHHGYVNQTLRVWAASAGIKKHLSWHISRHSFATLFLTSGGDIYTLSKLLGHSSVDITSVYGKIIDSKKVDEVNKLPQL